MKNLAIAAALAGTVSAPWAAVRAQGRGGVAGVAAVRGYTASPPMPTSVRGGPAPAAPADAEALAAPAGARDTSSPTAEPGAPAHRRHAPARAAGFGHGAARHRLRRA